MIRLAVESRAPRVPGALFALTVFFSAGLVFLVQPMLAKLVLPLLGGSPSVWNTSMAFFQIALLAGYGFAHALQRIPSTRTQALVHFAALAVAALALPLRIHDLAGPPSSEHPSLWLLTVLMLSIGAPFAVLSATAPLVQAWHARTLGARDGKESYALYAASNLGSLLALLAYPIVVEPLLSLTQQRHAWSAGYGVFVLLIGALGIAISRVRAVAAQEMPAPARETAWTDCLGWVTLAAIPSSLMLGVTTYITTDVASAPFLWVVPLALYLTTFILAFQAKPALSRELTLTLQGAGVAVCAALLPLHETFFELQLFVHLGAFFVTALMCHQRLVAGRPDPAHLTRFYLCLSLGGVVGGAFNAFLAPMIFDSVWEYPIVLALSCLARPWSDGRITSSTRGMLMVGMLAAIATPVGTAYLVERADFFKQSELLVMGLKVTLGLGVVCAFMVRRQALLIFAIVAANSSVWGMAADRADAQQSWRSFFGVLRQSERYVQGAEGRVRMLSHGTTLHGAQAQNPARRCQPMIYYTARTPIGQVVQSRQAALANLRIGVVGLGTGTMASYVRSGDHLTFFEIDPLVVRIATDPRHFSYTTECAKGSIDYVIGDARRTLAREPAESFDLLLLDAFSSDAVPAHLLTVEAMRDYLDKLRPDGVLMLHLSNRNLELLEPVQALARAAGGHALAQAFRPPPDTSPILESPQDAVIVTRRPEALASFTATGGWRTATSLDTRPWTDDYTNLAGALYASMRVRWAWLP